MKSVDPRFERVGMFAVGAVPCSASNVTYNIFDSVASVANSLTITGTLTTNGTIGGSTLPTSSTGHSLFPVRIHSSRIRQTRTLFSIHQSSNPVGPRDPVRQSHRTCLTLPQRR